MQMRPKGKLEIRDDNSSDNAPTTPTHNSSLIALQHTTHQLIAHKITRVSTSNAKKDVSNAIKAINDAAIPLDFMGVRPNDLKPIILPIIFFSAFVVAYMHSADNNNNAIIVTRFRIRQIPVYCITELDIRSPF